MPGISSLRARALPAAGRCAILGAALCLAPATFASGPVFSTLLHGSGQEFVTSVASDAQGNVYAVGLTYSPDFPVTAGAFQTKFGGTCDAFVAKLGPDGKVIWSTYLGGILDDWATGVALDSAGNVLVSGYTRSANFPLANAIQSTLNGGVTDDYDAFVAKLDPTGARLLYSTFLGGQNIDGAAGLEVDAAGNAYVAIDSYSAVGFPGAPNGADQFGTFVVKLAPQGTQVYTYFHPYIWPAGIALDATGAVYVAGSSNPVYPSAATAGFGAPGSAEAVVFKLSPDGSKKIYETTLGGSVAASGSAGYISTGAAAIAVNSAGEAYIAGSTASADFPLVHPLQTSTGARPIWKSADGGATWIPIDDLPFAEPQVLVADPVTPTTLYMGTGDLGIFKSVDGGATWTAANQGIAGASIKALAIDPVNSQTLYAATATTVYKSLDGAGTWSAVDMPSYTAMQIEVDAQNPNIVYTANGSIRKSTDGGATWSSVALPGTVATLALDPRASGHLFVVTQMLFCGPFCGNNLPPYLYRSVDGGATWVLTATPSLLQATFTVDPSTNPSTLYNGMLLRSVDGGVTWTAVPASPVAGTTTSAVAVDPSGILYAAVSGAGVYVSHDHAVTWTAVGSPLPAWPFETAGPSFVSLVLAGATGKLYGVTNQVAASGFISKLSADGSTLEYSTYLRGHASQDAFPTCLAEPSALQNQNWISGIALDRGGNVVVAGGTRAKDFPIAGVPAQVTNAGLSDAFAAILAADGGRLIYSTYFGGSADDGALAAAVDSTGDVILAGQTWSGDFPVPGGAQMPFSFGDGFVTKLVSGAPVISSVVNGASFQPGIEAGSWVTIKGTNLASTNPGRIWQPDEVVNGNLPTSLDGVSATIDGNPAFIYYISPTQINLQAPTDAAVGAVNVVVDNNGMTSAPATAQLQAVGPALFEFLPSNYAVATRLPDYALVADSSVVPGAVAAKPGDMVVLWGTGFGATKPPTPAGIAVSGAPVVAAQVTVTLGGAQVPVLGAVLTPGNAGLYQVTIQIPASAPAGAIAVQAAAGGVQSPAGVFLFVGTP